MNIKQAAELIQQAFLNGQITMDEACRAQVAIRDKQYYGNPMTGSARKRMLTNRFGLSC